MTTLTALINVQHPYSSLRRRSKRLLSLAAQKFVNDIASDAFHYAKLRMNAPSAKTGKAGSKVGPSTTPSFPNAISAFVVIAGPCADRFVMTG